MKSLLLPALIATALAVPAAYAAPPQATASDAPAAASTLPNPTIHAVPRIRSPQSVRWDQPNPLTSGESNGHFQDIILTLSNVARRAGVPKRKKGPAFARPLRVFSRPPYWQARHSS